MRNILTAVLLLSYGLHTQAQTNALWFHTAVPPTNILSPRQVCEFIETESAKQDPAGQGLTVVFHPGLDKWGTTELTFSTSPISFYLLLDTVASCYAFPRDSAKVFGTVGVIPWAQYRYVYTAIEGKCSDAQSGEPITNFSIAGGFVSPPLIAIQPDGYFVCGIQQKFDFSECSTATFAEHNITDIKQVLTFTAPGYTPLVITNEVYRPGDKSGLRTYDIKMERVERTNEGEQSVPGYPPQGVGSPEP